MNKQGAVVNPATLGYSVDGFARYAQDGFEQIMERYRSLCATLGWPPPKFILVGGWFTRFTTLAEPEEIVVSKGQSVGAYWAAMAHADAAYLSLYYDTEESQFDGSDPLAEQWLDANGYGADGSFTVRGLAYDLTSGVNAGGDLMDAAVVHQQDFQSASFFAHRMWRMIVEDSCPNDTNRDLKVDVNDLSTVLFSLGATGLAGKGPTALAGDANADGVVDVNDLTSVLFALGDFCPGTPIPAWPPE